MAGINQEVLIYQNLPYKKYRWMAYFSIIQTGLMILNVIIFPTPKLIQERQLAIMNRVRRKEKKDGTENSTNSIEDEFEINPDYDPSTIVERFKKYNIRELFTLGSMINNITERPSYVCFVGLSLLLNSLFYMYTRRSLHKVTLLPDERVRFSTFSFLAFSKPPVIEIPLRDVSCVKARKDKLNYSILKIRGYIGYHMAHKVEGEFLEPKLYDQFLGYQRSWALKKKN